MQALVDGQSDAIIGLALEAGRLDDVFRDLTRGGGSRRHNDAAVGLVTRREFNSYFATPLAFVFIFVFLLATGLSTSIWADISRQDKPI